MPHSPKTLPRQVAPEIILRTAAKIILQQTPTHCALAQSYAVHFDAAFFLILRDAMSVSQPTEAKP